MWENNPRGSCMTETEFSRLQLLVELQAKKIEKLEEKIERIEAKLVAAGFAADRLLKKMG